MSNWREKYLTALEEQDKLEKRVKVQSELLKRAVTNLSALASGQDAKVDAALMIFKDKLRGASGAAVHDHMLVVEGLARKIEQVRGQAHKAFAQELATLVKQLSVLRLPGDVAGLAKELAAKLDRPIASYGQYLDLLKATNQCQKLALEAATAPDKGLLQRLSGKKRLLPHEVQSQAHADAPEAETPAHKAADLAIREQLDEPTFSEVGGMIRGALGEVLSEVEPAEAVKEQYHAAKARLEHELDWHHVHETIEDIRDVLRGSKEAPDEAIEEYLLSVNKQLQDICSALGVTAEQSLAKEKSVNDFGQAVSDQVAWMKNAMQSSTDIDGLKQDVNRHIQIISEALARFRQEQQAAAPISEQLMTLIEKVKNIEQESMQTKTLLEQERHKATHDALTELPNRQAYNVRLEQEWQRYKRYRHPLSIAVCDVDHFKKFNDTYGHQTGDRVLKLVAKALKKNLREVDFVSRYGGEEFVLLLPETSGEDALKVVEKTRSLIAETSFRFKNEPVSITLSFGITQFAQTDTAESAFHRADQALYGAKQAGRNQSKLTLANQ